jgi:hypothetical protein
VIDVGRQDGKNLCGETMLDAHIKQQVILSEVAANAMYIALK